MRPRLLAVCAWMLWVLAAVPIVLGIVLVARDHALRLDMVLMGIAFNAFPLVGALIVSRRPRNAIGWICLGLGLGTATTFFDASYSLYITHLTGHPSPFAQWLDWVGNEMWVLNLALAAALLMLFPTGRPLTPRWRWLVWVLVLNTAFHVGSYALLPASASGVQIINPFGVPALSAVLQPLSALTNVVANLFILVAAVTAFVRFWRSRGDEREQMKWFAYGAATLIASVIVSLLFLSEGDNTLIALGVVTVPVGIGIAVLRYHLYDIDVIIRRTLIYGTLTAILAGVYFVVVLSAQIIGERLVRQSQPPAWLIVVTTLAIAALFTPLRRRVQRTIDHRFYRSRYNATRTVEAFAATLRTELNLSELRDHLVGVVEEAVRPEHVFLWLRGPSASDTHRD